MKSPDRFDLLAYIPYRFDVVIRRSALLLAAQYRSLDITRPQFHVLAFVATFPGISPKGIITMTIMDKSRVTRAIDGLAAKKLLVREACSEDKRATLLRLTSEGARIYEKIAAMACNVQRRFCTSLSEAEQSVLDRVLVKLDGALTQLEAEHAEDKRG